MQKYIYRGYHVTIHDAPDQNGNRAVISQDGKELARATGEESAYIWIDRKKREQSAGH